jgi:uncharacterized repeat protein (TIGR01451 family)
MLTPHPTDGAFSYVLQKHLTFFAIWGTISENPYRRVSMIGFGTILNTATVTGCCLSTAITDTAQITAAAEASLTISKSLCPETVTENGQITYTFVIQNSGNTEATAADGVVLRDIFDPILDPISVTYNGTPVSSPAFYTYDPTTGEFATVPGVITVPAATYSQDPTTGIITTTPGVAVVRVTGTV